MKRFKTKRAILFLLMAVLLMIPGLMSCAPDPADTDGTTADFAGGVFKGPFLVGSTVTIYPLDSELNQTGVSFAGDIVSDDGTYDISGIKVSGPVELIADGYYYDEITGQITNNKMTMRAITEDTGIVNINLFTALEIDRVRTLYSGGLSVTEAKAQAVDDLFKAFGLTRQQTDSEKISVGTSDGAALLAVSSMFAYGRTPAEVQSLITIIRADLGADGLADVSMLTDNAQNINASSVKTNLQNYYDGKSLTVAVPDFSSVLWSIFGSDVIEADAGNYVQLESAETVELIAGRGHLDGFLIPPNKTITFTINLPEADVYARFFNSSVGDSFICSDTKHATATGPGYFRLDFMTAYPDSYPYDFTIMVNNDGIESTIDYSIIEGVM